MKITVTLLVLLNLFALNAFAQDYTQWGLPEGAKARLGKGRNTGNIAYSPDGTRLAVVSSIGIWLYDAVTYQEVALLTGHTGGVTSVAYSSDGNTLASGSSDGTVLLWAVTPSMPLSVEPSILRATLFGQVKRSALLQNFPNPFNPETWIPYTLAHDAPVNIGIYDIRGQLVRQMELGQQPAGSYLDHETAAYWDGKDQFGEAVSSGVYFYTLKADTFQATRRMVILK